MNPIAGRDDAAETPIWHPGECIVRKRRILVAALVSLAVCAPVTRPAWACTRILWNNNGKSVLVARTMDLYRSDEATILVMPRGVRRQAVGPCTVAPWRTRYGSVSVTAASVSATDGLNEKGLVVNQLYLSGTQYEKADDRPTLSNISLVAYVLDNFATVDEAVAGLAKVRILSIEVLGREWPTHLAISDARGDSAIIEFINGQRVIHEGRNFRVMTNEPRIEDQLQNLGRYITFGGDLPIPGGIDPESRFVRASFFLKSLTKPKTPRMAIAKLFSVINTVVVPFDAEEGADTTASEDKWPTLWTAMADATAKVYYFRSSTNPSLYWVDLKKLNLAPGRKPRQVDAYLPDLAGDITGLFRHN